MPCYGLRQFRKGLKIAVLLGVSLCVLHLLLLIQVWRTTNPLHEKNIPHSQRQQNPSEGFSFKEHGTSQTRTLDVVGNRGSEDDNDSLQSDGHKHRSPTTAAKDDRPPTTAAKAENALPEDDERMENRRQRAEKVCAGHKTTSAYLSSSVPIVSVASKFLHCPVAKAASTFWSRFLLALTPSGVMDSPFRNHLQYPLHMAALNTPFKALGTDDDKRRFLLEATKNLFVRDPYSRMFSAYVDKVFAPNPYFWKEWGIPSVRKSRRGNRGKSVVCGHDVTFAEVMSYAAKRFTNSELHFTSAFRRCKPCEFKYDVIGKMETFAEDLRYLSNRLNLSLAGYFKSAEFRNDINKDAIEDSIGSPFSWMHDIRKCMTKHEAGLRIWRKLQIRGIISRRFPLPFSAQSFENVTQEQFIKTALEAHTNSTDAEELKTQKRQAFIEAYRTVDRGVLLEMIKAHKEDFEMFGYDAEPPAVFGPENGDHKTGAFNWQKPWQD